MFGKWKEKCSPVLMGTLQRQGSRTAHCVEASAHHSVKPLARAGTKEGRPDFWPWLIPVLDSEESAGSFTSAGLEYLWSSEEGIFSWD